MRHLVIAIGLALALGACSTSTRPLVPDTAEGPTSYICYSSLNTTPDEIRQVAERQCGRWGMAVTGLNGQAFTPMRCGMLTPMVAAFQCGQPGTLPGFSLQP